MMNKEKGFTVSHSAKHQKMTQKTVYGHTPKDDPPAFNNSSHCQFARIAIDSWIEEKTQAGAGQAHSIQED